MILQCNSCQKSFVVPDNAISDKGRLVQCSACGNKWKQFPINKNSNEPNKNIQEDDRYKKIDNKIKKTKNLLKKVKKIKKQKPYTSEYLKNKHGIKIINQSNSLDVKKIKNNTYSNIGLGFYGYIILLIVLGATFLGIINLTKENIIEKFPNLEPYLFYLFETLENIKIIFFNIFLD